MDQAFKHSHRPRPVKDKLPQKLPVYFPAAVQDCLPKLRNNTFCLAINYFMPKPVCIQNRDAALFKQGANIIFTGTIQPC